MKYCFCVILEKQKRVDMYISALFESFSRSYVQKIIDNGFVLVNGHVCKKNIKLQNRDELEIHIVSEKVDIQAEEISLDIIYEDENVLFINKDAWMNVHPVPWEDGKTGTLVNALLFHCREALPCISGEERPGIVHRLDKDTSGIIMVAKNDSMMHYLSDTIKERKIEKYYIAIVYWIVKDRELSIESYIWRDKYNRQRMTALDPVNPKLASTKAEIIDFIDNKYTVLRVKLETGRTHQIRVHLASIGYPIIGDNVYGNSKANTEAKTRYQMKRQALHAHTLELELYGKTKKFEWVVKSDMMKMIRDISI